MSTRTRGTSVAFAHPFELNGIDGVLPPGDYRVVTDEDLIECLSFPVYRRVATVIFAPVASHHASSVETIHATVGPRRDKAAHQTPEPEPTPPAQRAIGVRAAPLTRAEAQGHDDKTIDPDQHRGMAARKATDLRRMLAEVEANERSLCQRQDELESHSPAASWHEAAEKARYLLNLFSATPAADFALLCRSTVGFDRTSRARSRRQ